MNIVKKIFINLQNIGLFNFLSDKIYIKWRYKLTIGKKLNLTNPKTYNEKLQWLKLYDRDPQYVLMVDKSKVKELVANKIGEKYIIPTLGEWKNFKDINFSLLPNQFVLKCNHDSGGVVICKDKDCFDFEKANKKLNKSLKKNYYYSGREWPYKLVKPKIIAEKYMEDICKNDLNDYKFLCFNGEPKIMYVASERQNLQEETKFDFFDMNFEHLNFTNGHPNSRKEIKKPKKFDEMKKIAKILSKDIPQIRVDFYEINGNIYFGELTLFHMSGFAPFVPYEWDRKLGQMIDLSLVKKNEK